MDISSLKIVHSTMPVQPPEIALLAESFAMRAPQSAAEV